MQPALRRRRRRAPAGPILAVLALLALAGAAFAFLRARDDSEDPSRAIAQRFADAWASGDMEAAWRLTTARSRAEQSFGGFRDSYRQAAREVTARQVRVGRAGEPHDGRVPVPVVVRTRLFGDLRGTIAFPVERRGGTARVAWVPALRLPGLRAGERVHRRVLRRPGTRGGARRRGTAPEPRAGGRGARRRGAGRRRSRERPRGVLRRPPGRPSQAPSCATGAAASRASRWSPAAP